MTAAPLDSLGARALPPWRRLSWRLGGSFLLLASLAILVSGFLQYRAQAAWLRESLGALLLNIARTGSLLLDGDLHRQVVAEGREDTPGYARLRDRLLLIQEANELGDAVYTFSDLQGDTARFGVIGNGLAPIGGEYRVGRGAGPVVERALRDGVPTHTDLYVGPDGSWISAFAPVKTARGETVAVLGVDFRADLYGAELGAMRRRLYVHSAVGALLALVAGLALAHHITRPVARVIDLARAVAGGDLTPGLRVRSRDEVGLLGNVFHLMVQRLRASQRSVIDVLVRALEARAGAPGSLSRLGATARALGERLGLTPGQAEALELGALLHDIGDIRSPAGLPGKPGPPSAEDRDVVARHPAAGVAILEAVPLLAPALDVVAAHHERWDGGGYPRGLRGDEIPLAARIFAVVDALDAMTRPRPDRGASPLGEALERVRAESGRHFDPRVVEAALAVPAAWWSERLGGGAADPAPTIAG
jgi:HAMP domain-containing protein